MKKFHRPNRRKQEERPRLFAMRGGRRYSGRLRQCFGQDNAGDERIAREMAREHRIVAAEAGRAFRRHTWIARDQFAHKNERRPVWQAKQVIRDERPAFAGLRRGRRVTSLR